MHSAPSLYLILLHNPAGFEGYAIDYEKFGAEVGKYKLHGRISDTGWYVVSADDELDIKNNLARFIPELSPSQRFKVANVRIISGSVAVETLRDFEPLPDPLSERLLVIPVYQPGHPMPANAAMKALYTKLTETPLMYALAQVAAP
jgi:hypothetical protein